jgi:hypothetical protein
MIIKKGDEWQVRSKSGKVLGRHDSKEKALRQLRAVEAHYTAKKN